MTWKQYSKVQRSLDTYLGLICTKKIEWIDRIFSLFGEDVGKPELLLPGVAHPISRIDL
jgi:hypothetical protein